jgi:hypothetical protein
MTTGECRSCGAAVIWCKTANGKTMPVNAEPDPKGNIVINQEGEALLATYLTKALKETLGDITPRYTSHFSNCPHAAQHRKA